jgi:hypothetical protein
LVAGLSAAVDDGDGDGVSAGEGVGGRGAGCGGADVGEVAVVE